MNSYRILTLALLLVLPGLTARAETVNAIVNAVSGTVESSAPGSSSFTTLTKGKVLPVGSTIRTGDDGTAVLVTTPGSAIRVGNDSLLKINDLAFTKTDGAVTQRKARLQLTSGAVSAMIDPSTPKITDFKIQTPQGVAAARGTFYAVAIRDGKTYVAVNHGKVGVLANP